MSNLALFVCGIVVTLISGLGIVVYMVSVAYDDKKNTLERKKTNEDRLKEKIDADLGVVPMLSTVKSVEPESIIGIPSVS